MFFAYNINSGYTGMMGSGEWGVGSRGMWNDGESGVVRGESSVGQCRIIDLDFIIPMQPETI